MAARTIHLPQLWASILSLPKELRDMIYKEYWEATGLFDVAHGGSIFDVR